MKDKQIHTDYWINGAVSDFETCELLIQNGKYLHGLFFCHLVIEKALKAHYVKVIEEQPPRTHNLLFLNTKINIIIDEKEKEFLGIMLKYQLEGRYPEFYPPVPNKDLANKYLQHTKEILQWLKNQL